MHRLLCMYRADSFSDIRDNIRGFARLFQLGLLLRSCHCKRNELALLCSMVLAIYTEFDCEWRVVLILIVLLYKTSHAKWIEGKHVKLMHIFSFFDPVSIY